MFRTLPPLTRGIIIALIVSALLSLAAPTLVVSVVPLYPELALKGEIWRFLSYPFFILASMHGLIAALMTLLWTGFILVIFGGELETIVHTKRLTLALTGAIVLGGIIFCVLGHDSVLVGPGIITMFLLTGFSYLWPKREISVFGIFWVKAWVVTVVVFLLSIIPMNGLHLDTSAANIFGPTFGALAAMVYFHSVYRQYRFGKPFLDGVGNVFRRKRTPGSMNAASVESRIDEILDKIASRGMDSLTKDEKEFLLRNSK